MSWRRSPRRLGSAVERIREDLAPQTLLGDVQSSWIQAVGAAIAAGQNNDSGSTTPTTTHH